MAGPFTNFLIGQGKGVATSQGKNLTRAERKRLADRIASGEFIPKGNFPTEFNGQVNTNVRQPIDGEVVPQPSGLLNRPQAQLPPPNATLGRDGGMSGDFLQGRGLPVEFNGQVNPNVRQPIDGALETPTGIGGPQRQGLLGAPPKPPEIDPKTGRPYGQMAGTAGIVAGGGVLLGMDGNEGSANANLTPEQIQEDKDGRAQMIKDAEDIKSGAATPDQLLRATNFQRMEAAASGRPIEKINKPEGLDQGFWETLGGKFDMTAVGLALMASSANGQPFGANLGRALQVGVMSADSKKALSKADQTKADAEAKRDKIRTDALALADTKYNAVLTQQAVVNSREDEILEIRRSEIEAKQIDEENKAIRDRIRADVAKGKRSAAPPTGPQLDSLVAQIDVDYGEKLNYKTNTKDRRILDNIILKAKMAAPSGVNGEQWGAYLDREIAIRFKKGILNDTISPDPVRQPASARTPAAIAGANSYNVNVDGVDIIVN